ncbi:AMP-binding protein [Zhihengliuella salsuginis]|uniref:Fatty-acyl-CoA synthase n=1 Tax=Zhihengliuella salsuginis TaxID=578222 RepID=A0ABQ3GKB6_9MICC|nr:AMP-binding protein [Zhihengliuella salsuginis]GHD10128.1 fatty-acyl-CoA synthase [Zhihengliuella salsuginis]
MTLTDSFTATDSYTAGGDGVEILEQTIGANFRLVAGRTPGAVAMEEALTGRSWTYAEMDRDTDELARALMAAGIEAGDRVGIWSPNCAEWTLLQYATSKMGAILVNINPAYRRHELEFVVGQCGMKMLVAAPDDERSDFTAMARGVLEAAGSLEQVVLLPDMAAAAGARYDGAGDLRQGESTFAALVQRAGEVSADDLDRRLGSLAPDDAINLQYTSGTTGFPKGVTLSHRNLLNNGFHIGSLLSYAGADSETGQDKVVIAVPFFHCFGMVIGNLAALSHGASTVVPGRAFKADEALAAVQRYGGTSLYGVPTMFIAELALPDFADYDLSTLRTGVMAGSTCPVEVMKRVISEMNMSEVAICYGMTETSPVSTMTRVDDSLARRTQTVGRTMPHLESKIVSPLDGAVVARGEQGELCTRGYAVMQGYWNDGAKTAEAIDEGGWMHTGDLASMDPDGYVRIEGRIKDLVIRGGENISPREIEEFLYQHPSVQDVQVIGVPDEKYGEEIMACIILKEGVGPLTVDDVREYCTGRIAHYKIPRYVQVRSSFPMTVSGKVRKVEMRAEASRLIEGGEA